MAINPNDRYPGQTTAPSADYPYGGARNQSVPGDNTGTPLEADLINDIFGFQQALLEEAGIMPSGTPDKVGASQYLSALKQLFIQQSSGYVLRNITVIDSAGADTYETPSWARALLIYAIGGGGAGGGAAATGPGEVSGGGGGGAGSVCALWVEDPDPDYDYTIGAGGSGVSGGTGQAGGDTTIAGMTAGRGTGGLFAAAQSPPCAAIGGGRFLPSGTRSFDAFSANGEHRLMLQAATTGGMRHVGGRGGWSTFASIGRGGDGTSNGQSVGSAEAGEGGADGGLVIFEFA